VGLSGLQEKWLFDDPCWQKPHSKPNLLQLFRIAPVCTLLVELLRTILQEKIWYPQMLRGTFRATGKIAL